MILYGCCILPFAAETHYCNPTNGFADADATSASLRRTLRPPRSPTAPSRNSLHQTSWGRTDGAPEAVGSSVEPDQSLYIKISVQWLTFGFFFLACKVSYNAGCEDESDQCLFCWEGDEEEA
mmetsp:Transcript_17892/g.46892  ORF Transcript_17892/g.46892 Transcript_17892/m.46892 type:complete len:122 (-) Transcript_17892:136-501(-)